MVLLPPNAKASSTFWRLSGTQNPADSPLFISFILPLQVTYIPCFLPLSSFSQYLQETIQSLDSSHKLEVHSIHIHTTSLYFFPSPPPTNQTTHSCDARPGIPNAQRPPNPAVLDNPSCHTSSSHVFDLSLPFSPAYQAKGTPLPKGPQGRSPLQPSTLPPRCLSTTNHISPLSSIKSTTIIVGHAPKTITPVPRSLRLSRSSPTVPRARGKRRTCPSK
jgi:hypothetical protein